MNADFDVLPGGFLSFRDDGTVLTCNVTLASWLGYARSEIVGRSVENIFTISTRIFYNTHFYPLVRLQGKADEIFLSFKTRDGEDIPVLLNAKRILDGSESVIHCLLIRVEERKKYEQELLNAKREAENALRENEHLASLTKSLEESAAQLDKHLQQQKLTNENLLQFSKVISHDLTEPIHKIKVFVDLIANDRGTQLSEKSKRMISKVDRAADRLGTITNSLQEYIAVDFERSLSEVDVASIVNSARMRVISTRKFSEFDLEIANMPLIDGYQKQLELLFFHLIDNAVQFRELSRKLTIKIGHLIVHENTYRMSEQRYNYVEHVRIWFEDNGTGFSDEYYDYVFKLFTKLHADTSGMGIGLALVKRIVHNHSGSLRVASQPGKGTRFEIEIPLKPGR